MPKTKGQIQVEFLNDILENKGLIVKANFSNQHGLTAKEPTFHLTLMQNGVRSLHQATWSPELEEFLLARRQKMATLEEEQERFATLLSHNLATAEASFGKDYAQAVFVELLRERREYKLENLLAKVPVNPPSHDGSGYIPCRNFLQHSITGLQNTAVLIGYRNNEETVTLVGNALSILLDDRFYITLREQVFAK